MNILFIVLNEVDYLEDILDMFLSEGVKGATVLDSQGLGQALPETIPMFGSIRYMMDGARPYNKTIFSLIEDNSKLERVIKGVYKIVTDLDEPGVGMMFTIPVKEVHGMDLN